MMTKRCGYVDPDDSWGRIITVLVCSLIVYLSRAIRDALSWLWHYFLPDFLFCVIFAAMVCALVFGIWG